MVPENFGEESPSPEKPGFDGPGRDPKDLCRLIDCETLEIHQHDRAAELFGYLLEGRFDIGPDLSRLERVARSRIRRIEPFGQGVSPAPLGAAQVVVTGIHGDPIEPGTEGGFGLVAVRLAEDGEEGLLRHVEGRITVTQHAETDSEHAVLVGAHQLVERREIPAEVPSNQVDVFSCAVCHVG